MNFAYYELVIDIDIAYIYNRLLLTENIIRYASKEFIHNITDVVYCDANIIKYIIQNNRLYICFVTVISIVIEKNSRVSLPACDCT